MPDAAYYVAQTAPQREYFAQDQLSHADIETYLPECKEVIRHARQVKERTAPLFPGYIFLRIPAWHQPWRTINTTPGIIGVLSSASVPAVVQDWVIDGIRARAGQDGGTVRIPDPTDFYEPGDPMRVTEGPLTGLTGCFMGRKRDRIKVLLDIMGRRTETWFPIQSVEAVPA